MEGKYMTRQEQFKTMRETHAKMLLNKRETAKELSISEATLDRLRNTGQIKSKQIMGQVMFTIDEIARFITEA